ncbi:MAG: LuxR family two component transcriptional regulator [Betaproteobacteria bacterium]|nr:LuxR family two component transcriptional regulator [Betaproteobacteria bacterium]
MTTNSIPSPLTVLLVDDHAVVREGYRRLLERSGDIQVAGEAGNSGDAYQLMSQLKPAVVVMDISLPDVSGIEAARRMLAREPAVRVLIFSMHEEAVFAARALQAGARGYVTKASAPEILIDAVRAVARGEIFLSPDIAQILALKNVRDGDAALQSLSAREFEVMRLLATGHTLSAIAAKLGLSYKTVANHQSAIRQKTGAQTAVELLRIAQRSGLVPAGNGDGISEVRDAGAA